jgi:hypothetical protein
MEVPLAKTLTPISGSLLASITLPEMVRWASKEDMQANASAKTSESFFILIQFVLKKIWMTYS